MKILLLNFILFSLLITSSFSNDSSFNNCVCTDGAWTFSSENNITGARSQIDVSIGDAFEMPASTYSSSCISEDTRTLTTNTFNNVLLDRIQSIYYYWTGLSVQSTKTETCEIAEPCEDNQYRDENGTCVNDPLFDIDGDGVPDSLDAFPDDPLETTDTDGDGIGDEADWDSDNDTVSDVQEAIDGTDPLDSGSNNGSPSDASECASTCGIDNAGVCSDTFSLNSTNTPIAEVSYLDCTSCEHVGRDVYGLTCDEFFGVGVEEEEEIPIDSCEHDSQRSGYAFQSIEPNQDSCTNATRTFGDPRIGANQVLRNCSLGYVACFYNTSENTAENNETYEDVNTTDFDDSNIVTRLDDIKLINETIANNIKDVDSSVNKQTDVMTEKFNELQTTNSDGISQIDETLKGQTTELGTKLDGIQSAIEEKDSYPLESESMLDYDDVEVDGMLGEYGTDISNQMASQITAFDGDLFTMFSISIPTTASCGCTDIPLNIDLGGHSFNKTIEVCDSLDGLFAVMRPLLWFVFLIGTLLYFFRKD